MYFVVVSNRRLSGPQPGHHDRCSPPPDRLWEYDGEPVLLVDLIQTTDQNHELWLAQIRSAELFILGATLFTNNTGCL